MNKISPRRPRAARPPRRRPQTGVLAVTVGLVLLTAACGASPSSTGSPSSTSSPSSTGSPSSSSSLSSTGAGGTLPALVADELAFARCMRAHGVPNYPDPDANGQMPPGTNKQQLTSNPRLPSASRECSYLIPQSVITAQNQVDQREYVRFAECMRTHGMPNFPDPTTESDGTPIFNLSRAGVDTQSPQVRTAAFSCQSLLHLAQLPRHEG